MKDKSPPDEGDRRTVVFSDAPGTVLDIVSVPIERPRDRTGDTFTDVKAQVLAYFEGDEDEG